MFAYDVSFNVDGLHIRKGCFSALRCKRRQRSRWTPCNLYKASYSDDCITYKTTYKLLIKLLSKANIASNNLVRNTCLNGKNEALHLGFRSVG